MHSVLKFLLPFSWLYALGTLVRNKFFEWGVLRSVRVGVPVISVGNLTVGGTGKTPLVEHIVRLLIERKKRVAVVSRGYKRKSAGVLVVSNGAAVLVDAEQGGDEPVQIARKFPTAIVVVGEKRVAAASKAIEFGAEIIVMDDGFQHRYLHRNLDILVVDATHDLRREAVLPAGRLREPMSGARRAHLIAVSNFDDTVFDRFRLDEKLRSLYAGPLVKYRHKIVGVRRANDDAAVSLDVVRRMKLLAFSGIGKHEAFLSALSTNAVTFVTDLRFPDHHGYTENDCTLLSSYGKAMAVDGFITTEKDMLRLRADRTVAKTLWDEMPVFYLIIEVDVLAGQEELLSRIENL